MPTLLTNLTGCANGAGYAKDESKIQRETCPQLRSLSSLVGGKHEHAFMCEVKLLTAASSPANRWAARGATMQQEQQDVLYCSHVDVNMKV